MIRKRTRAEIRAVATAPGTARVFTLEVIDRGFLRFALLATSPRDARARLRDAHVHKRQWFGRPVPLDPGTTTSELPAHVEALLRAHPDRLARSVQGPEGWEQWELLPEGYQHDG